MRGLAAVLLLLTTVAAGCAGPAAGPAPAEDADPGGTATATPAQQVAAGVRVPPARPAATQAPDPVAAGPLAWARSTFTLEPRIVDGAATASPYVVVPEGSVHAPEAGGPYPVVVLLHGRHGTCAIAGQAEVLGPPCPEAPPVVEPVDSFAGYDYLAENLASHGYVVASLSANHVNDHDNDLGQVGDDYGATARARLVLSFLDDLRAVEAGGGPEPLGHLEGRLDLSRVGLLGHSRGGEGVARAATLNAEWPEPHALRAVFALAPTDFDRHVVTGVPLGVLLPYCDGDVSNLQGAWMVDDAAARDDAGPIVQVLALGANHNWYNTVWTGSDWGSRGDGHCDLDEDGRDSPQQQREHGLAVFASFLRLHVGGESAFLPLATGEAPFPQPGLVVTYLPPAARRLGLELGSGSGFTERDACTAPDCPIERTYGTARQTYLAWESTATLSHPIALTDAAAYERVALRVGFDHATAGSGESPVVAVLEDAEGRVARVPLRGGVFHPPGDSDVGAKTTLNLAWAPLSAAEAAGVDTTRLAWLRVEFQGSGAAQVADVHFQDLR